MTTSLGARGEQLAVEHLERTGWTVLHRNFRVGHKEIDLIATRDEVVAFIEVKARSGREFGHPLEAITPHKRGEIRQVAEAWVQRFGAASLSYRFDAIAVTRSESGDLVVHHLEDAWGV